MPRRAGAALGLLLFASSHALNPVLVPTHLDATARTAATSSSISSRTRINQPARFVRVFRIWADQMVDYAGLTIPRHRQRQTWQQLVLSYRDWNGPLMLKVAFCESTDRSWVTDPVAVTLPDGEVLHAQGILQVLGGSFNSTTNVRQAHRLWLVQGYRAWASSERCWG